MISKSAQLAKKPHSPLVSEVFLRFEVEISIYAFRVMRSTSVARWVTSRPPPVAEEGSVRKRRGRQVRRAPSERNVGHVPRGQTNEVCAINGWGSASATKKSPYTVWRVEIFLLFFRNKVL